MNLHVITPRTALVSHIESLIAIPLNGLSEKEARKKQLDTISYMGLLKIFSDFQAKKRGEACAAAGTSIETRSPEVIEYESLKARVVQWRETMAVVPSALATAAATSAVAASTLESRRDSSLIPTTFSAKRRYLEISSASIEETVAAIKRDLGASGTCISLIALRLNNLRLTVKGTSKESLMLPSMELFRGVMRAYALGSPTLQDKMIDLFDYIIKLFPTAADQLNPYYAPFFWGQYASHKGSVSLFFNPVHLAFASVVERDMVEDRTASSITDTMSVSYLEQCYKVGTLSAWHLASCAFAFSHSISGFVIPEIRESCDVMTLEEVRRFETEYNQEKRAVIDGLARSPVYAKIHEKYRLSCYLKVLKTRRTLVDISSKIQNQIAELCHFGDSHHPFFVKIAAMMARYERSASFNLQSEGERLEFFKLLAENYDTIKSYSKGLIEHFELMSDTLRELIRARKYTNYLILMQYDATVDWEKVSQMDTFDFINFHFIDKFPSEAAANIALAGMIKSIKDERAQHSLLEGFDKIARAYQDLLLVEGFLKMMRIQERYSSSYYLPHVLRLRMLQKEGVIIVNRASKVEYHLPSASLGSRYDELGGEIVEFPPLPRSSSSPTRERDSAMAAVDESPGDSSAASAAGACSLSYELPIEERVREDLYMSVNHHLRLATSTSRFTSPVAKTAFLNGLYYASTLNSLLRAYSDPSGIFLNRGLAHFQQDIGTAAFYAFEQLLTALMFENNKITSFDDRKALVGKTNHQLRNRYAQAKLYLFKEIDFVRSIIERLETVNLAICDLPSLYPPPEIFQNTLFLLSNPAEIASRLEIDRSVGIAHEALGGILKLIYSCCLSGHLSSGKVESLFARLSYEREPLERRDSPASSRPEEFGAGAGAGAGARVDAKPTLKGERSAVVAPVVSKKAPTLVFEKLINEIRSFAFESLRTSRSCRAEERMTLIDYNLNRLRYLRQNLEDSKKTTLYSFYASQARFVINKIMEELLCAACEHKILVIDQEGAKHNLFNLAKEIVLDKARSFVDFLTEKERLFLQKAAARRNELRYDHAKLDKPFIVCHELTSAAASEAGGADDESDEAFTIVLSERNAKAREILDDEITMLHSIMNRIKLRVF